jgi:hypothetical protein
MSLITQGPVLETTLSTTFVPSTNLTDGLARASWRFLLPSLQLDGTLCLGLPPLATLRVLAAMSSWVSAVSTGSHEQKKMVEEIKRERIPNVRVFGASELHGMAIPDKSVSLMFLADESRSIDLFRNAELVSRFLRVLGDEGVIYFETHNLFEGLAGRKFLKKLSRWGFESQRIFWLTPLRGELQTAFPLRDHGMSKYLFISVLPGQSRKMRMISCLGSLLSRTRLLRYIAPRHAMLLQRSEVNGDNHQPPQYLVSLGRKAGVDLTGLRSGLSARGKYNANKTIIYLFDDDSKEPKLVVKITRAAEFNYRLENEYRALSLLREKGFVDRRTFPELAFFGRHANLAILGEQAVRGVPFRSRTKATVNCPLARKVIDWIVDLGIASSERSAVSGVEVGQALMKLLQKFDEIYKVSGSEYEFLHTQIMSIGKTDGYFPLVFQHGDPGTHNILVSRQAKITVLDWEAAETQGMPLWDLFYFMRTYGNWISRKAGITDQLRSFGRHFLESSEFKTLLSETITRYRKGIGLDDHLIEPLFYTCWMHRSLKESTRLSQPFLQNGTYVNLLRFCIAQRNAFFGDASLHPIT